MTMHKYVKATKKTLTLGINIARARLHHPTRNDYTQSTQ